MKHFILTATTLLISINVYAGSIFFPQNQIKDYLKDSQIQRLTEKPMKATGTEEGKIKTESKMYWGERWTRTFSIGIGIPTVISSPWARDDHNTEVMDSISPVVITWHIYQGIHKETVNENEKEKTYLTPVALPNLSFGFNLSKPKDTNYEIGFSLSLTATYGKVTIGVGGAYTTLNGKWSSKKHNWRLLLPISYPLFSDLISSK